MNPSPPPHSPYHPHHPRGRGHFLFWRFAFIFGLMALLVVGGMATLAYLLTRLFGGNHQVALAVWLSGCGLTLFMPTLAFWMGQRAFRGIARPLAELMTAAEAVAEGNFKVRVREGRRGEFGRLGQAFNQMVAELERADQQRRNLTADVAHELRTPLHIIQGNLEGLLDGVYEPTVEHIEATLEETRLLARLVGDLQTLSLAEAGQLPLQKEAVAVGELLADVATSFSGQAEAGGLALRVTAASGLVVWGDAGRLDQLLSNLVVNSLRYTPAGGEIRLTAAPAGDQIEIRVTDTGLGIPAGDLPYIFDRFWRGDRARTHHNGGAGLGLAIVRQLVQAHAGTINVSSQPGQGTSFIINLPAHR